MPEVGGAGVGGAGVGGAGVGGAGVGGAAVGGSAPIVKSSVSPVPNSPLLMMLTVPSALSMLYDPCP